MAPETPYGSLITPVISLNLGTYGSPMTPGTPYGSPITPGMSPMTPMTPGNKDNFRITSLDLILFSMKS